MELYCASHEDEQQKDNFLHIYIMYYGVINANRFEKLSKKLK